MKTLIVKLRHMLYAFHEMGKLLKVGPLVVNSLQRAIDKNGFFYAFHLSLFAIVLGKWVCRSFRTAIGGDFRLHPSPYSISASWVFWPSKEPE
jgi:hypothetical protein